LNPRVHERVLDSEAEFAHYTWVVGTADGLAKSGSRIGVPTDRFGHTAWTV